MAFVDKTIREKIESSDLFGYRYMLALKSISDNPEELNCFSVNDLDDMVIKLEGIVELAEKAIKSIQKVNI